LEKIGELALASSHESPSSAYIVVGQPNANRSGVELHFPQNLHRWIQTKIWFDRVVSTSSYSGAAKTYVPCSLSHSYSVGAYPFLSPYSGSLSLEPGKRLRWVTYASATYVPLHSRERVPYVLLKFCRIAQRSTSWLQFLRRIVLKFRRDRLCEINSLKI
jgi:hypothetical protein